MAERACPSKDARHDDGRLYCLARQAGHEDTAGRKTAHFTGMGVAGSIGTAETLFLGEPSISLSEYVR